jgi:hypothetical protein
LFKGKTRIDQSPFFSFQNFANFWRKFGKTFDSRFRRSENKLKAVVLGICGHQKFFVFFWPLALFIG